MKSSIKVLNTGFFQVNTLIVPCTGGFFVTDPGGDADEIARAFEQLNASPCAAVLTHAHLDHIAGLRSLLALYPDIEIIVHKDDALYLGSEGAHYHVEDFALSGLVDIAAQYAHDLPNATRTVCDGDDIFGWQVIHTPGHSPGSMCLYSKENNTLLSGDTLFRDGYGRTDLHGGDSEALFESLTKLSTLPPDTIVFPGHGAQTTIGSEFV